MGELQEEEEEREREENGEKARSAPLATGQSVSHIAAAPLSKVPLRLATAA